MTGEEPLISRVRELLDDEGFVLLCQELGGVRVYLPMQMPDHHDIVQAIGRDRAEALSRELAPAWLRVPLARRERALYWRGKGLSNARVALKLGIGETAVNKIFAREESLPAKPISGRSSTQLDLF